MHHVQCLDLDSVDDDVALPESLNAAVAEGAMNMEKRAMPVPWVARSHRLSRRVGDIRFHRDVVCVARRDEWDDCSLVHDVQAVRSLDRVVVIKVGVDTVSLEPARAHENLTFVHAVDYKSPCARELDLDQSLRGISCVVALDW